MQPLINIGGKTWFVTTLIHISENGDTAFVTALKSPDQPQLANKAIAKHAGTIIIACTVAVQISEHPEEC